MNQAGASRKRDVGIDALRLVACCGVVGLHTFTKGLTPVSTVAYYASSFAIPVFFMLSGAFLLNRGRVGYSYTRKKVSQLAVVLGAWVVVCTALEMAKTLLRGGAMTLSSVFGQLFDVLWGSLLQSGPLSHCWFLWALALLYVILPFLSGMTRSARLGLLATTVLVGCGLQVASVVAGYPVETCVPQVFRFWTWLSYFLLGGLLYPLREKRLDVRKNLPFVGVATVLAVLWQMYAAFRLMPGTSGPAYAEYFYGSPFVMAWCCALFLLAISTRPKSSCWVDMGTLCMGVYLIHLFIVRLVDHICPFAGAVMGSGVGFVVVLAASFALVAFSKRYLPSVYKVFFALS